MLGRKIRGLLPQKELIFPNKNFETSRNQLIDKQQVQKLYYDRGTVNLKPLKVNDDVYVQKNKDQTERGKVVTICDRPRSYGVQLKSGPVIERNRKHLYTFTPKSNFEVQEVDDNYGDSIENSGRTSMLDKERENVQNLVTVPSEQRRAQAKAEC